MNLSQNPTLDELQAILKAADDSSGNHQLWVDRHGVVHLSVIPQGISGAEFAMGLGGELQFRFESYVVGGGYVGPTAAKDQAYLQQIFDSLLSGWAEKAEGLHDY